MPRNGQRPYTRQEIRENVYTGRWFNANPFTTLTQGEHMPNAEVDEWGAVVGCTGPCCTPLRLTVTTIVTDTDTVLLTLCMNCGRYTGEGVECTCHERTQIVCNGCLLPYFPSQLQSCSCGQEYLCRLCRRNHQRCGNPAIIHNYTYKPPAKFAGDGPLYLGVELEVDRGRKQERGRMVDWHGNPDGVLDPLSLLSQSNTLFYFKDDGSLTNGFELVTHPCSLSYHQASFPWQDVLEELKKTGLQSHNTTTCGLHIHASRLGFGRTTKQQEAVLGKLIMLWGRHWWRYAQLSRRRVQELSSWCLPNREAVDVVEEDMVEMLETVKKPANRSVAINTVPWEQGNRGKETVEFRLFKGTLNYSSLMAALEIVHHSITLAKSWKFDKVVKSRWRDVVGDAEERGYTYLVDYVKERGVE